MTRRQFAIAQDPNKNRSTMKRPSEEELVAANKIISTARHADEMERVERNRQFVGKFFRYRNSYGPDSRWWMYFAVTGVKLFGGCHGVMFQKTSLNELQMRKAETGYVDGGGYEEITASEFARQARAFAAEFASTLAGVTQGRPAKRSAKRR